MNIDKLIEELHLNNHISLSDIPKVDLYMDQVIQLFENAYSPTTRNMDEKVLTKTMINNYAKGKLLPPIKNKKYSRNHLILLSLIYQLKGGLSINDIKMTLDGLNTSISEDESFPIDKIYTSILNLQKKNTIAFKEELTERFHHVQEEELHKSDKKIEQLLLITTLIHMSNQYRRLAEKLVDELNNAQL